ncbi:MAG: HAMP domain-containing histidine kinase [Planctomycetes bacterium]|nr:HAMP domain-containing histidine kinase [Planctomycetota bacterium]
MPNSTNPDLDAQASGDTGMRRPLVYAGLMALSYLLLSSLYIWISSHLAAHWARSVEDLERIEKLKGLGFVALMSLFTFVVGYVALRRMALKEREIVRHQMALVAAEKRATAGLFAASVAHDINNLLMPMNAISHRLAQADAAHAADHAKLQECIARISNLSRTLMNVGKTGVHGTWQERDLNTVLRDSLDLAGIHTRIKNCQMEFVSGPEIKTVVNAHLLHQMLLNLVLNAADATDGMGRIRVSSALDGENVLIRVEDNGPGIPEALRNAVFQPFFTTKANGTGLGLLSVKACAELHGGSVALTASAWNGACFEVRFPQRQFPASSADANPNAAYSANAEARPSL